MYPWICPRCKKVNAPWLNQCFCEPVPSPITIPGNMKVTDGAYTQTGSFVLTMED